MHVVLVAFALQGLQSITKAKQNRKTLRGDEFILGSWFQHLSAIVVGKG